MKPENFHFVSNETGTPTRQFLCADIVVDGDFGFAGLEYDNSLSISQFAPGAGVQTTAPGAHGWQGTQVSFSVHFCDFSIENAGFVPFFAAFC